MDSYLNLVKWGKDAIWALDAKGQPKPEHTCWKGFHLQDFPSVGQSLIKILKILRRRLRPLRSPVTMRSYNDGR